MEQLQKDWYLTNWEPVWNKYNKETDYWERRENPCLKKSNSFDNIHPLYSKRRQTIEIILSISNPFCILRAEEVMFGINKRFTDIRVVSDHAKLLSLSKEGKVSSKNNRLEFKII